MIRAVIFDMFETLITHYHSPLHFGAQMAEDAGIIEERFQALWRPTEYERTIGKLTLEEVFVFLMSREFRSRTKKFLGGVWINMIDYAMPF